MDYAKDNGVPNDVAVVKPEDVPPPPSYEEVMGLYVTSVQQSKSELPALAYIDIMPRLLHPGNLAFKMAPTFQTFEDIMDGANVWLRDHPELRVWKCETVERKVNAVSAGGQVSVDLDAMSHTESIYGFNCFVFGLRLWLTQNTGASVQQLGLTNILPHPMTVNVQVYRRGFVGFGLAGHHLMHSSLMFEPYEGVKKTIERFNAKVKDSPIPGSVLNVETTNLKFAEGNDKTSLEEAASCSSRHETSGTSSKRFTQILRLFYVKGTPTSPQLKMAEFIPEQEDFRDVMVRLKFSKFDSVIGRLAEWVRNQQGIQIVNIETRDAKVNRVFGQGKAEVESDSSDYFQLFKRMDEQRLRFIRVFYIDNPTSGSFGHTAMTSRLFVPVAVNPNRFESMTQTMTRIDAWLKATGLPIFGVDTVLYPKEGIAGSAVNSSDFKIKLFNSKTWVTAIRVYFPSAFEEPDASLLPPLPVMKSSSSCVVL